LLSSRLMAFAMVMNDGYILCNELATGVQF
jgi:hypothetical protein